MTLPPGTAELQQRVANHHGSYDHLHPRDPKFSVSRSDSVGRDPVCRDCISRSLQGLEETNGADVKTTAVD